MVKGRNDNTILTFAPAENIRQPLDKQRPSSSIAVCLYFYIEGKRGGYLTKDAFEKGNFLTGKA
jgi:hypothetical protein